MTLVPPNSGSPVQVATAVTVVPAPGPGLAIIPLGALLKYTFVTTAYTDHGGSLFLRWGTGAGAGVGVSGAMTTAGFWTAAQSQVFVPPFGRSAEAALSTLTNLPLMLQQDTANPTLGDGTLTATVAYTVVATS